MILEDIFNFFTNMFQEGPKEFSLDQWFQIEDYSVCLHSIQEEFIFNPQKQMHGHYQRPFLLNSEGKEITFKPNPEQDNQGKERVIYLNVEYKNMTQDKVINCRKNQWHLFDVEGYSYENEGLSNYLYKDQNKIEMKENYLNPSRNLRGWIAFIIPKNVEVQRIQFLTGYLGGKSVDLLIPSINS